MDNRLTPAGTKDLTRPDDPAVLRYACGCEVVVLAAGISADRTRCPEAERLHNTQARLSSRLMRVLEGADAEQKLIAKIEKISDVLVLHRKMSEATLD